MFREIEKTYQAAVTVTPSSLAALQEMVEAQKPGSVHYYSLAIAAAQAVGLPSTRYAVIAINSGSLYQILATSYNQTAKIYKNAKPYGAEWMTEWVTIP